MRVAIIGSRNAPENIIYKILNNIPPDTTEIVSGGADGIDSFAEKVAAALSVQIKIFRPNYPAFGKSAPLKRNEDIISYADLVLAFWDGESKGTQHVIAKCISQKKRVKVIRF